MYSRARTSFLAVLQAVLVLSLVTQVLTEDAGGQGDVIEVPQKDVKSNEDQNVQPIHLEAGVDSVQAKFPVDKDEVIAQDPYGHLVKEKGLVDLGFIHAFVASLSVIIVSELGDKTFFIAAIMAMRHSHSRFTVYLGAMGALGFMTVMSAILGYATTVIPHWFTYYASSALFAVFGLKMMKEGYYMSPDEGKEEMEEAQAEVKRKEEEVDKGPIDSESGLQKSRRWFYSLFSRIFLQSFTLTFLAEWGDRSQISTIILAARDEVIGVILGGTLGHALCTGLAVLGGQLIARRISIRTVHLIGGVVFIIFAMSAFVIQPDD